MELSSARIRRIKLLTTIVERGKGDRVTELLRQRGVTYHLVLLGHGTAKSEILEYFGLGETEKDVVMSVILEEETPQLLELLSKEFELERPGNGILFTIPISGVGGPMTLQFISGLFAEEE